MKKAIPQGRDLSLRFAPPEIIMCLVGAPKGVRTWHCPLPNHRDAHPSFSAGPGREPGTTVVACSCGQRKELLAHFRKLGYRLGPMKQAPVKRTRQAITVTESVAFRVLTRAEQTMYAMISRGENPTYNDFVAEGVHRQAIPGGIRALQALDLIGVKRSPRRKGCQQYEQNEYWKSGVYPRWEPSGASKEARKTAVAKAKARANAARKGGEDISEPSFMADSGQVEKTEGGKWGWEDSLVRYQQVGEIPPNSDLRISEVRVRGTDSGTESYVVRIEGSGQDSTRPSEGREVQGKGGGKATPMGKPPPPAPCLTSGWHPPCGGLDCGKDGECLRPGKCGSLTA